MTELARSIDTGEIFNAKVAWEKSCEEDIFTGASMFKCLDDDNCSIQMTLTNFNDKYGKRKFFTPHKKKIGHDENCVMENGTREEKEDLQKHLNPNVTDEELKNIIENGNKKIVVREPQIDRNNQGNEEESTNLTEEEQEKHYKKYDKTKNKGLGNSEISSIGSLFSYYNDNPETIISDINWSFFNKDNQKMGNRSFVKRNFPIKDIFCKLDEQTSIDYYAGKIYIGKAWINARDKSPYKNTVINFVDIPDVAICWANSEELTGIPNAKLFREARDKHFPIYVCVAGYFYESKDKKINFKMRTNEPRNCLYIPNEE
ncbi:hypothetical protein FACS1894193_00230 [Bacilli bacterium]|nr:hypothetical protein FACS1894193_00230 [Bacilli bacterium]